MVHYCNEYEDQSFVGLSDTKVVSDAMRHHFLFTWQWGEPEVLDEKVLVVVNNVVGERRDVATARCLRRIDHVRKSRGNAVHSCLVQIHRDAVGVLLIQQTPRSQIVQSKKCIRMSVRDDLFFPNQELKMSGPDHFFGFIV